MVYILHGIVVGVCKGYRIRYVFQSNRQKGVQSSPQMYQMYAHVKLNKTSQKVK